MINIENLLRLSSHSPNVGRGLITGLNWSNKAKPEKGKGKGSFFGQTPVKGVPNKVKQMVEVRHGRVRF